MTEAARLAIFLALTMLAVTAGHTVGLAMQAGAAGCGG